MEWPVSAGPVWGSVNHSSAQIFLFNVSPHLTCRHRPKVVILLQLRDGAAGFTPALFEAPSSTAAPVFFERVLTLEPSPLTQSL